MLLIRRHLKANQRHDLDCVISAFLRRILALHTLEPCLRRQYYSSKDVKELADAETSQQLIR